MLNPSRIQTTSHRRRSWIGVQVRGSSVFWLDDRIWIRTVRSTVCLEILNNYESVVECTWKNSSSDWNSLCVSINKRIVESSIVSKCCVGKSSKRITSKSNSNSCARSVVRVTKGKHLRRINNRSCGNPSVHIAKAASRTCNCNLLVEHSAASPSKWSPVVTIGGKVLSTVNAASQPVGISIKSLVRVNQSNRLEVRENRHPPFVATTRKVGWTCASCWIISSPNRRRVVVVVCVVDLSGSSNVLNVGK